MSSTVASPPTVFNALNNQGLNKPGTNGIVT
jgi:hypothetical protein